MLNGVGALMKLHHVLSPPRGGRVFLLGLLNPLVGPPSARPAFFCPPQSHSFKQKQAPHVVPMTSSVFNGIDFLLKGLAPFFILILLFDFNNLSFKVNLFTS